MRRKSKSIWYFVALMAGLLALIFSFTDLPNYLNTEPLLAIGLVSLAIAELSK